MVESLLDLIGNTPILKINNIYLKLEYFNPSGSIKDRMSLNMIKGLEEESKIKKGSYILETSSGNTGISLAMICAIKGYKLIILMYDDVTVERVKILNSYGAKVILISRKNNIEEVGYQLSKRLQIHFLDQHTNPLNYLGYNNMAKEIIDNIDELDYLVCGLGTGGTICGLSSILKKTYPNLKVIGILPENYKNCLLFGINSMLSDIKFNIDCIDEVHYVSNEDALQTKKRYCHNGIFVGNSSGAILFVSEKLDKSKKVLAIIPDNNFKYLSCDDI